MKRNDCSIVQDLLPLYMEDMLQPDTVDYVNDHLSGCETCTNLLAELKSADTPAPDAEDARTGDQQVLKLLWKKLTLQSSIVEILSVVYLILHCFPWTEPQSIKDASHGFFLLVFTLFPLFMGVSEAFCGPLPRNKTLLRTAIILPVALLPLLYLIGNVQTLLLEFSQGKYENAAPAFRHETVWSLLSAAIRPAFLLTVVCGILITVISLYHLWSNHLQQYPPAPDKRIRFFTRLTFCFSILIFLLHFIPLPTHNNANIYPFATINLFYGAIPFCFAIVACLCHISSLKGAVLAALLTLPLLFFAIWPILALCFPSAVPNYFWMGSYSLAPLYNILFFFLSILLSATAICSVWYKLKQQTREK